MGSRTAVGVLLTALALPLAAASPAAALDGVTEVCTFSDDRFTEISGMTYSQRHPGVVYLHNDSSGGPRIYAVDAATCDTLATLTIEGIEARDIEAIGSGTDPKGRPILWVGDIGDNVDGWPEVRLHRVREPKALRDRTLPARTYRVAYPDQPHNAEALLADPGSTRVWLVSKQAARGTVYALPERMSRGEVNIAEPVGEAGGFVTDGAVSPDGSRIVLRDYVDAEVRAGLPPGTDPQTVYLPLQPQGEAITWTPDGSALLVASENDDRLLRVAAPTPTPTPTPTTTPTPTPTPTPSGESRPSAGPGSGPQLTAGEQGAGTDWVPTVGAVGLVLLAVGLIGGAEWRRRRSHGPA